MMNLLCVITLWVTCAQTQILTQKFGVQENKKVVFQNTGTIIRRAGSQIICAAACFHHDTCCVASYDNALQSCHMDTSGSCLMATKDSVGWTVLQSITVYTEYVCNPPSTPRDCGDIPSDSISGVYTIYPEGSCGMTVYCDVKTAGGPWTVFQRRLDGSVSFYRSWNQYENGFGNVDGEFWLGNYNLHLLTWQDNYKLRVSLTDWDLEHRYALYQSFSVGNTSTKYELNVTDYSGTAGDALFVHNGMPFSTFDQDNDQTKRFNCAEVGKGGFWYFSCQHANLNGLYNESYSGHYGEVVAWQQFRGLDYSLKYCSMMVARQNISI